MFDYFFVIVNQDSFWWIWEWFEWYKYW